jgi:hypothetical protein
VRLPVLLLVKLEFPIWIVVFTDTDQCPPLKGGSPECLLFCTDFAGINLMHTTHSNLLNETNYNSSPFR